MKNIFDINTLRLLRFPYSFFLMPVYCLALSQSEMTDDDCKINALLVFIVLHVFVYPAGNAYNVYINQDSAGKIEYSLKSIRNLFYASLILDVGGLFLSWIIGIDFCIGILVYILASRAYTWKGIRLKKYPVIGILWIMIFKGAITFLNVYVGINTAEPLDVISSGLIYPMIASSLMIGGIYPFTQISQYEQDKAAGDTTIGYILGYKGTFIFSAILILGATGTLFVYFSDVEFMIFLLFLFPLAAFFVWWFVRVSQNITSANYENTMHMNLVASVCMNTCFLVIFIVDRLA